MVSGYALISEGLSKKTCYKLIETALNTAGAMFGGQNLFVPEGNIERNEFRVVTADESFKNNLIAFSYSIQHGYVSLGMYTTREAAENQIDNIRAFFRDEDGKCLL